MLALASLTTGLFVALLTLALLGSGRRDLLSRVQGYAPQRRPDKGGDKVPGLGERVVRPMVRWAERSVSRLMPANVTADVEKSLMVAGARMSAPAFLATWVLCIFAPAVLVGGLTVVMGLPLGLAVMGSLVLMLAGFCAPLFWLRSMTRQRQRRILRALPDTLDLIAVSVEAGLGLEAALARVADKLKGPLSDEISRTLREIAMGRDRHEALTDLGERTGVDDLRTFVLAIVQAEQLGVGIAQTLKTQSDFLRMRRRQQAELAAQQAPVKMVFPLVFLIFPAMMMVILGPAAINLFETFSNR
ncbi:MAG TPA: type II secretion system F family protein [Dehalococcoidia bacterium]|nr:type II secretion system F family protein [Dehalococcoidia bacterium]